MEAHLITETYTAFPRLFCNPKRAGRCSSVVAGCRSVKRRVIPCLVALLWVAIPRGGASAQTDSLADDLAQRVLTAVGGLEAWEALPYLQFNFGLQREQSKVRVIRHLWSRATGEYRMELPGPADEPYVVLFNVGTGAGTAFWNGTQLDGKEAEVQIERALRRFQTDAFWLTAPFRLFEPGVERSYSTDSSDAAFEMLELTFAHGGPAPGAVYRLHVERETGLPVRWTYRIPGDPIVRSFACEGWEEHQTAAGPLRFSTRKRSRGRPFVIHTDNVDVPRAVAEDAFTSILPFLSPTVDTE